MSYGVALRNGVPFTLGTIAALCVNATTQWNPLSLWPNGISSAGMWISPRALTSQWQNYTGTTPVSTPGTVADSSNPVGLAYDLRAGTPVLGPELVTNGDFSDGTTGWNAGHGTTVSTLIVSGGVATLTNISPDTTARFVTTISGCVVGRTYRVQAGTYSNVGGSERYLGFTDQSQGVGGVFALNSNMTAPRYWVATATTMYVWFGFNNGPNGATISVDNISVKEVPGNHMSQVTSTARPLLSARRNLFIGSELYASDGWSGTVGSSTVTLNALFVGNIALSKVTISTTTGNKGAYNLSGSPSVPFTVSGLVKADGYRYLQIYGAGSQILGGLVFDAVDGVFSQNTNSLNTSVSDIGGGVFKFSVKHSGAVDSIGFGIIPQSTATTNYGNQAWTGDGTSGMYLGGFAMNIGSKLLPYQRVTTASDYDATGSPIAQKYDGVDDSMATAAFAAGTLINGMDCMIAVRRDSAAATYLISNTGSRSFFEWESGDTNRPDVSAGTPTYYVDGVAVTATRGALFTALTVGDWHILEARGLDLSTWTALEVSSLVSYRLNGPRGDIMLYPSTASTEDKDAARQWLADYYGVTLP